MSADLPPLPDELRQLFDDERAAPAGSDDDLRRIGTRIAATVGLASALGASASASAAAGASAGSASLVAGITGKVIAIVIAVGAIGGATALVLSSREAPPVAAPRAPAVRAVPRAIETPPAAPIVTPLPEPLPPPAPPRVVGEPPVKHAVVIAPAPVAIEDEPTLLVRAWSAHARGEAATVLELVERDAREHPDGALAEERDALRVDALRQLDRLDEARTFARAFIQRYPHSLHRALVAQALQETP